MSDFDAKDIHEDVTSDFAPEDIVQAGNSESKNSLANTLVTKAAEGGSLGFDDELAGALSAAGRAAGVNSLGGKIKDISMNPEGPTLDLDILLKAYRDTRDKTNTMKEQMSQERPKTSLAANVAGGLVGGSMLPGLSAAKEAGLASQMGIGALNGAGVGALAGAGGSKADLTQGDLSGVLQDTKSGAELGGLIGGAAPAVMSGLSAGGQAVSDSIPSSLKDAFTRGKQGINTTSQDFLDSITGRLKGAVDSVSAPIENKVESQAAQAAAQKAELEAAQAAQDNAVSSGKEVQAKLNNKTSEDSSALESRIGDLKKQQSEDVAAGTELEKASLAQQQADQLQALNKETVETAKRVQEHIYNAKKILGKQYDAIDEAAEAAGVAPDNRPVISALQESLTNNANLPETEINSIMKKITPHLGDTSFDAFRSLKRVLSSYSGNSNPAVRRAMGDAYSALRSGLSTDLQAAGQGELAGLLNQTNKKWSAASELEDQYLSNLRPNRVTGEIEPSPDTIRAIGNFSDKNPVQIANSDYMSKLLQTMDPEKGPGLVGDINRLSARTAAAKLPQKPVVPELPNPKLTQMQSLLDQIKGNGAPAPSAVPELPNPQLNAMQQQAATAPDPTKIPGLNLPVNNTPQLKDTLTKLLPKVGNPATDDISQTRLQELFDFLGKEKGPEFVNQNKASLAELNKDINLRNIQNKSSEDVPSTLGGVVSKVANKAVSGATGAANKAGMAIKTTEDFLQHGVKTLSNADGNALQQVASKLQTMGAEGAQYAKILTDTIGKNDQSRNAMMFSLMQQPQFRKLFHKVESTKTSTVPESLMEQPSGSQDEQ